MKWSKVHFNFHWKTILIFIVLFVVLLMIGGCGPTGGGSTGGDSAAAPAQSSSDAPSQGAQPQGSNWDVQRFKTYNKVWASLNSTDTLNRVYKSGKYWEKLYLRGYVTTNKIGEAKLKQGECFVYVYQKSKYFFFWKVGSEVVESKCEKGGSDCCSTYQNCKVVVKTFPANITFKGTLVTVIELMDKETTIIMTHQGDAEVMYTEATNQPNLTFTVSAEMAAFVSTPAGEGWARDRFGFEPGTPFSITEPSFINALVELGFLPQMRRLNDLLASEGLDPVPVVGPPTLNVVILNDGFPDSRAIEAMAIGADWNSLIEPLNGAIPTLYYGDDESILLSEQAYSPDNAQARMAEAGYTPDSTLLPITLWYNSDQSLVDSVAQELVKQFSEVGFKPEVRPFNDGSAETEPVFQGDLPADAVQMILYVENDD